MRQFVKYIRRYVWTDAANTAVEYAVMLALILLLCVAAVRSLGCNMQASMSSAAQSLGS
jgi:pilus assembly protein Flp/PilA